MKANLIREINDRVLKEAWKRVNVELLHELKDKQYFWKIRFIEEDFTIYNQNPVVCSDDSATFNCAIYAADYLRNENRITKEVFDDYAKLIHKLYNQEICYS